MKKQIHVLDFNLRNQKKLLQEKIKDYDKKFFIAKVDKELFCYKINGFTDSRFIDKEIKIIDIPVDFVEFRIENELIRYLNKQGQVVDLQL